MISASGLLRRLINILLLALLYYITGQLGLLLAIPPGYATAVWPASGIALGALLLFDRRLWPGILLGSFLINISLSLDLSSSVAIAKSLFQALSVAAGATAQALLGLYLIRRYVNLQTGLTHARSVVSLFTLGGPVSCLVSATWGVGTLWLFGSVPSADLPFTWANWWVGDAMGVAILLPLLIIWFGTPAKYWRWRRVPVAVPLLLALVSVVAFFTVAADAEQERIQAEYRQKASIVADSLNRELDTYVEVLRSIEGLFLTAEYVDRSKFEKFVSRSLGRIKSIQALSWNPHVTKELREVFESAMQRSGFPDFRITERNAQGEVEVAASYPAHVVVQYIAPFEENRRALGYDVYSHPQRRLALDRARDAGDSAATAPIKLVQESGNQSGVLLFLPIYHQSTLPQTVEDRRNQLRGFVVAVLRMGDVIESAMQGVSIPHTEMLLIDETDANKPRLLTAYAIPGSDRGRLIETRIDDLRENGLSWSATYRFGGRQWRLLVNPNERYLTENRSWSAWAVLAGGLLLTALLGSFLLIITGQTLLDKQQSLKLSEMNSDLNDQIEKRQIVERSLRHANKRLERLATVDHLTGAYNRRYTHEYAKRVDADMRRYKHPYSIIIFDVDNFKQVNDRLGHDLGDRVLREIADRVKRQLRETDCLGRWGGEEFLVVAKETELAECIEVAQRLCRVVNDVPVDLVGSVSISLGVSFNNGADTLAEVIKQADQALYSAKQGGRNRVEFSA